MLLCMSKKNFSKMFIYISYIFLNVKYLNKKNLRKEKYPPNSNLKEIEKKRKKKKLFHINRGVKKYINTITRWLVSL